MARGKGGRSRRDRRKFALPDGWCTVLPALENLGPLLKKDAAELEAELERQMKLPDLQKERQSMFFAQRHSVRRLHGDSVQDDPQLFDECLQLPMLAPQGKRGARNRGGHPLRGVIGDRISSAAQDRAPFGQSSGNHSHAGRHHRDSGNSQRRHSHARSVQSDSSQSEAAGPWHLFLLTESLTDSERSAGYVTSCLADVLNLEAEAAESKAMSLIEGDSVVHLEEYHSEAEARLSAQKLRDRGLIVRVADTDCPDAVAGGCTQKRVLKIADRLRGTARRDAFRLGQRMIDSGWRSGRRDSDFIWRGDLDLKLKLVPEDPVAAYFEMEEAGPKHRRRFRSLVKKHSLAIGPSSVKSVCKDGLAKFESCGGKSSEQEDDAEAKPPRREVSPEWKEACRMMRIFLFGAVGNEGVHGEKDKDRIFHESMGTKKTVSVLYGVWLKLDTDGSGRCDIHEFRTLAEQHLRSKSNLEGGRLAGFPEVAHGDLEAQEDPSRFILKFCERLEKLLLAKKSSFVIEDMMRIIWPCATIIDIKTMKQWCQEFAVEANKSRILPPPVLPRSELEGLCSVFKLFDTDGSNSLTLAEMAKHGLIDEDRIEDCQEWDKTGNGSLDMQEFCEMMCPAGFRATQQSTIGSLSDGRRVVFDQRVRCWREADVQTTEASPLSPVSQISSHLS